MPRLDRATRNIAIGLLQAGESQNEVARTMIVNQSTISRLWNRFQQTVFHLRIEPLPHQPLQPEYLDCEEPAHKQSATAFDRMALDPEGRISKCI
jgi:transposase